QRSEHNLCPESAQLGLHADGGLAEYLLAPAQTCLPYADHVPADHAAVAEPLSVAVRALRRSPVEFGSCVAVFGAGSIGLLAAQVARAAGASTVIVVEPHPGRRALAERLGADAAVAPEDAAPALGDLPRHGPDIAIEAAGSAEAVRSAIRLLRPGG